MQTGTLDAAELPEGAFDAVVLGDVIEHLPDPAAALERIRSLLAPGGVLHLAAARRGQPGGAGAGARDGGRCCPPTSSTSRARSLARLLPRHGFAVEWMGTAPKAFTVRYYLERLEGYSAAGGRGGRGRGASGRVGGPAGVARLPRPDGRRGAAQVTAPRDPRRGSP